jgi:hypothetical protein
MVMMTPPTAPQLGGQTYPQSTAAHNGIIYQGAASGVISARVPPRASAASTSSVTHAPRYANAILSILNPPSATERDGDENDSEKRRNCGELLDTLIPPLFCQMTHPDRDETADNQPENTSDEQQRDTSEKFAERKRRKINQRVDDRLDQMQTLQTNAERLKSLEEQLEQYKLQNQRILERRMSVFNSFVELHECYETGLDGIARANDLRNVPDNVMMDRPTHSEKCEMG